MRPLIAGSKLPEENGEAVWRRRTESGRASSTAECARVNSNWHEYLRDGNGGTESTPMGGGRLSSIAAVALAFLASQHHNFMMLLLAFGLGDTAMSFMTAAPLVRAVMLGLSLAMIAVIAYQIRDSRRPQSTRVMGVISIIATVGLSVWSITRFGF